MDIIIPTLGKERQKTYSPFLPICPDTGKVLEIPLIGMNVKKGTVVFFQSTPNSYHGVKRFVEKNCPKRFFIYGSYALNKPVIWNYKGTAYYPHIISTKKRMLTSFHDANYLTTAPKN